MADNEMKIALKVDTSQMTQAMRQVQQLQNSVGNPSGDFGAGAMGRATGSLGAMAQGWLSNSIGIGTLTTAVTPAGIAVQALAGGIKAAGALAVDSVKDYANFEGTLKQVQIIAGGTQADMDMLGETAIKVGGSTSKGAQEVAEAMVDFAKLGFTAEETATAMTGIVYAAEASGSSVETTAQIVATSLNVWGMAASDAEHVADVLAKTSNETAADMTDLGYTLQYAGSSASLAGASMEQLSAMAGIMADNGIRGSKAGTSLRTAFTNLIAPTEGAMTAMENLGVSWQDAEGKARPTMDVIRDLQDATQGLSDLEIQDLSTTLFGKPGAAGMSFVLKTTRDELDGLTTSLENSTGTAARQAAEMRQTMEGQLDQLGDSWDAIKLKIGKGITGTVALKGVEFANEMLDKVSEGLDAFAKEYERTSKILEDSHGMISTYEQARELSDSLQNLESDLVTMQTDPLKGLWEGIKGGSKNSITALQELDSKAKEISYLDDGQVDRYLSLNDKVSDSLANLSTKTSIAYATMRSSGSSVADVQKKVSEAVYVETGQIGQALAEQGELFREAETNRLSAIAETLNSSESLSNEVRQKVLANEMQWGQMRVDSQQANMSEILRISQEYGTMTYEQQAEAQERVRVLTEENNGKLIDTAHIQKDATLAILQQQSDKAGGLTQTQKDTAITAANEQYTSTTSTAMQEYLERVASIESMASSSSGISADLKETMLTDARNQLLGTTKDAGEMRDKTVDAIQAMDDKADESDGKRITMETNLKNFGTVMAQLASLLGKLQEAWNWLDSVNTKMGSFTGAHSSLAEKGGLVGMLGDATGWYSSDGFKPKKKARGGLTSGVGGVSKGATYNPNATARGVGTQLGQGGIPQASGVVSGERGTEVTLPIGNTTYMRPFAQAIAQELESSTGSKKQDLYLTLEMNSRNFAQAVITDIDSIQKAKVKAINRAKGVGQL